MSRVENEKFIDKRLEALGAEAFPDFMVSLFPESGDAKEAARKLISWAATFVEHTRDWPILEIEVQHRLRQELVSNTSLGFDRKRDRIMVHGSFLELNLPLHVFNRVSVDREFQLWSVVREAVVFSGIGLDYEEKLSVFSGGKVEYSRSPIKQDSA